jgi:hypothetical protein
MSRRIQIIAKAKITSKLQLENLNSNTTIRQSKIIVQNFRYENKNN